MARARTVRNPHFILECVTDTEAYRYAASSGGSRPDVPERDRPFPHSGLALELKLQIGIVSRDPVGEQGAK